MRRISTLLVSLLLPLGVALAPASAQAVPATSAAAPVAAKGASYYGKNPKAIAKKLGQTPAGGVLAKQGVKQLTTDQAVITTYKNKKQQNKAARKTQQIVGQTGFAVHAVWGKGVIILVLDNLPETAAAVADKLKGAKVKTFAP